MALNRTDPDAPVPLRAWLLAAGVLALLGAGLALVHDQLAPASHKPTGFLRAGLTLRIRSRQSLVKLYQWPDIEAEVVNASGRTVRLIRPGEGSQAGLRPPVLAWSLRRDAATEPHRFERPSSGSYRCGNIPAPGPEDVLELAPGDRARVWVDPSGLVMREPGTYRVVLYLENRPRHGLDHWRMLAPAPDEVWEALEGTDPLRLRSNELVVRAVR